MNRNKLKKQFTREELLAKGFREVEDGGETYLIFEKSYLPTNRDYLITNDYSSEENDSWFVDYGYTPSYKGRTNCLTNLDEKLVDDFVYQLGIGDFELENWFEKLITRMPE